LQEEYFDLHTWQKDTHHISVYLARTIWLQNTKMKSIT